MNPVDGLTKYLSSVERRLRLLAWAKGAAIVIGASLILTIGLAGILTRLTLSPLALVWCRTVLFLGIDAAIAFAVAIPWLRLSPRAALRLAERKHPEFEQRLQTFSDRRHARPDDPFLTFLAADTLEIASFARPEGFVKTRSVIGLAVGAVGAALALAWLLLQGPGRVGYDAQALWAARSLFSVAVKPGGRAVSRGSDFTVSAHLNGFDARTANLWVRYAGSRSWKPLASSGDVETTEFEFKLAAVPADAEFYAEAQGIRSAVAKLHAVTLPRVKNIRVSYADQPGDSDGNLIGSTGTVAGLVIETDRPMNGGQLILDSGVGFSLPDTESNRTSASLTIRRSGTYHIEVTYHGKPIQVSKEYVIQELRRDTYRKGPPGDLPEGVRSEHSGKAPPGYERAVNEYFRRLNELKPRR